MDGSGGFGACSVFGVQNPLSPGLMVAKGGKCLHPSFALPFISFFFIFQTFLNNFFLLQWKRSSNILVWCGGKVNPSRSPVRRVEWALRMFDCQLLEGNSITSPALLTSNKTGSYSSEMKIDLVLF